MKVENLKTGKVFEAWKIDKKAVKPDWVQQQFDTGFVGWRASSDDLRVGDFYGSPVAVGAYLLFDGKKVTDAKAADFEKKFRQI